MVSLFAPTAHRSPTCVQQTSEINVTSLDHQHQSSMDLSRTDDSKQQQAVHKAEQPVHSTSSKATSATTSGRSSRSNSIEGLRIAENEFINGGSIAPNPNHTASLNSSSFVSSLSNCVSSSLPYVSNGQTAAYNVNQDFLLRMAMQNNQTSANNSFVSNSNPNMFHSKIYNDNLAAVAAAVANGNSHTLYQNALSSTSLANQSTISNSSTISAAHHLAALNPHNSAFQNLQQQSHSHQPQAVPASSTVTGQHMNGHASHPAHNISTAAGNSILPAEHLLSMTNGTNQSLLAVTNGLINGGNSNNLVPSSLSSLSNNGSTNSSTSSTSSLGNNSQMMLNEQLINQNLILASPSSFAPFDPSANNLFSGIKKRKRSPQPIPQDLKDDAYWDRRRRNSKWSLFGLFSRH